jgi:TPR repeat protein
MNEGKTAMKDLDDFNKLEERAWTLTGQLEERAQKSGQAGGSAMNGIDEQSEKKAYEMPEEYDLLISKHEEETEKGTSDYPDIDVPEDDDTPERSGKRVRQMLKQDPTEAKRVAQFYTDMANDGNANAQYELANFYLEGIGVEKNEAKAKELLQKAAKQGHKEATKLLDIL